MVSDPARPAPAPDVVLAGRCEPADERAELSDASGAMLALSNALWTG